MNETFDTQEEALKATLEYKGDGVDEFDGMNCNDYLDDDAEECTGWDGVSRRCDCGNRRVSWTIGQFDNGKFYAYAEAW